MIFYLLSIDKRYLFYRLRWAGHVARMEEGRSTFRILTGKPTGKRPLGRPRRRWEYNIRMDLTLREECRLKVFENRILRRMFGPKGDANGKWRRLLN